MKHVLLSTCCGIQQWLRSRLHIIFYSYEIIVVIMVALAAVHLQSYSLGVLALAPLLLVAMFLQSDLRDQREKGKGAAESSEAPGLKSDHD